jgi:alpha-amylase/alpha-mannosidase (GH57 family)
MERYVCIHGHFYQPPRENPWLEAVEVEKSAYPYHDWNQRIEAECYGPNATARILDDQGRIARIVNNYGHISFNFGPTLLSWMDDNAPETYQAILEADYESIRRFSGHGSAMAQSYIHLILPLANRRDKKTQVLWGIRDFEHHFRRRPEGMWAPETAVDTETLEIFADSGIRFTILSPHQARRVRPRGQRAWTELRGGGIDPTRPYIVNLPSGKSIVVFFYDGPISQAIAFEGLLRSGVHYAGRLLGGFSDSRPGAQLVHVATDGETYGHHHQFGEMALAFAIDHLETNKLAQITNYGEFLERYPPEYEAEIAEATSWSCAHGVERWRSNCGCNAGGHPEWSQAWREPLRTALDWLRDRLAVLFENEGRALFANPWIARDHYIQVVLDRSTERTREFLARHAKRELSEAEQSTALKLLEMQRHAMLMFTSCGWFFDDISRIEGIQVLRYAGRAMQLAQIVSGESLEDGFLRILERAESNVAELGNGRSIYERSVKAKMVGIEQVIANYAVGSLFDHKDDRGGLATYNIECSDTLSRQTGKARLRIGRARVQSQITLDVSDLHFAAVSFRDHNITCGARPAMDDETFASMRDGISTAFEGGDFTTVVSLFNKHFGDSVYGLRSLFRDQQQRILDHILESSLTDAESVYRRLYQNRAPLMRFLADAGVALPEIFQTTADVVLNAELRSAFETDDPDFKRIESIVDEAKRTNVSLDAVGITRALQANLEMLAERLFEDSLDLEVLQKLHNATVLSKSLGFEINLRRVQNYYYEMLRWVYPEMRNHADPEEVGHWIELFLTLGRALGVRVD